MSNARRSKDYNSLPPLEVLSEPRAKALLHRMDAPLCGTMAIQDYEIRALLKHFLSTGTASESETRTIEAMQAKIDSLMLQYCPDEMTEEQKAKWAAHQKPTSCPHAAPFVYCEVCKAHPCPLGLTPE